MSTPNYNTLPQYVDQESHPLLAPQISTHQSQNVIMHQAIALGPQPIIMSCPNCHASIKTAVTNTPNCGTHLCCVYLFVMCCGMGCCILPYFMNSCQAQKHTCPSCEFVIGIYQR